MSVGLSLPLLLPICTVALDIVLLGQALPLSPVTLRAPATGGEVAPRNFCQEDTDSALVSPSKTRRYHTIPSHFNKVRLDIGEYYYTV